MIQTAQALARQTNVLVVEDDIALCRILRRMLSDEQYKVKISRSLTEAMGTIEQRPFDVYVVDYKLPDGGGIDVAKRIRSKDGKAPIILISGHHRSGIALRARNLDISEYLAKPFSRATLCNAVKNAIGSLAANPHPADSGESQTKPSFLHSAFRAITRLTSSISA
jgi:DNA-binding NtrC family response regulator